MTSPPISLTPAERAMLAGDEGPALQLAMRLVLKAAEIMGARALVPIGFAHLDACFYAGEAHVDFARFLLENRARFAVPTWTNATVVSRSDPDLRPCAASPQIVKGAHLLRELYEELGAAPTWTCAPYQLPDRPKRGDHIVAGESNAVTFYNSVIGARTNKYGDYLDVACAMIGKAPYAALHTDQGRKAALLFKLKHIDPALLREQIFFHLLGHHVGRVAGRQNPAIEGLPANAAEDDLRAVSAAVASSGGVDLWHGIGVTPEAPDLASVFATGDTYDVTPADLIAARDDLTSGRDGPLDMVALGTPHFSFAEFAELHRLLDGRRIKPGLVFYVSTSRFVRNLIEAEGWLADFARAGITIVTDVCTYYSPAVRGARGRVMTNAAKWAYYAPGMLGVEVCFGSLGECVESAMRGEVWRDPALRRMLEA
ncbi:MAG: aconitase X catalytic domain-containing protein [Rhizobiales bacterium]|nr:aconitase X catalytic domain-containing protein [Hyphomicrobiales bacterium]